MLYSTFFVAALAAISSVSAMPAEAADRDRDRDRDRYDLFRRGECRSERDELYCGRGINQYSRYDEGSRYCRRDRVNRVFCAYREQREFVRQIAEEWRRIEECELDEYWDISRRRCECYRRRDRDGDRDRECRRRRGELEGDRDRDGDRDDDRRGDRDGDRGDRDRDDDRVRERDAPNCKNGDIAFCAANEDQIVTFERQNILCTRGRGNYVFCASPERDRAREKARDHFRKERKTA
ncbi:hypothetical protein CkaCkLH20_07476 [Colletotrichum karsti]|uniref:Nipped-B-like protein B n=1 Tax=Colletotrichum karsti TaxID=1095194 RepID=A0A9P6I3L0_9PEZI|nr:uncharacterized protein CkaCkLH20_07476 [Colletotrichum karsti]KAF9875210.1 hypothetical protein CkaCkLH20_07476 [Colletotrichum karsti]